MDAHFSESATTSLICTVEVHVHGAELVMKFMTNKYYPHISGALAHSKTVITSPFLSQVSTHLSGLLSTNSSSDYSPVGGCGNSSIN